MKLTSRIRVDRILARRSSHTISIYPRDLTTYLWILKQNFPYVRTAKTIQEVVTLVSQRQYSLLLCAFTNRGLIMGSLSQCNLPVIARTKATRPTAASKY